MKKSIALFLAIVSILTFGVVTYFFFYNGSRNFYRHTDTHFIEVHIFSLKFDFFRQSHTRSEAYKSASALKLSALLWLNITSSNSLKRPDQAFSLRMFFHKTKLKLVSLDFSTYCLWKFISEHNKSWVFVRSCMILNICLDFLFQLICFFIGNLKGSLH